MDFGQWKRFELERLSQVDWKEEAQRLIRYYEQSLLQAQTLAAEELYCAELYAYHDAHGGCMPCKSLACIRKTFEKRSAGDPSLCLDHCYASVSKWTEQQDGSMKEAQAFLTNYKGEVVYFDDFDNGAPHGFENEVDKPHLYVGYQFRCRTPYRTGDIIEIDGSPCHDKFVAVLYVDENEFPDNSTSYEWIFYINSYGRLKFSSIQHFFTFTQFLAWTRGPLYTGEETGKNKVLFKIGRIMKQGDERAKRLCTYLYEQEFSAQDFNEIGHNDKMNLLNDMLKEFPEMINNQD